MESMNDWARAEQHAERAQQFFQNGLWSQALTELKAAVRVNPRQSEWHFGMGLALEAMHRHGEALDCFRRVLALRGSDEQTLEHLGINLIEVGRCREAIDALEQLARINPDSEPSYCYRILAHAMLEQHDQAEQMFYMARLIRDECPLCYEHLAQSLAARERIDKAIWCWQRVLRLEPQHPDAHLQLGHLLWQRGQRQRARLHLLEQIHREPHDAETLLALANLLLELDRDGEAEEILAQTLAFEAHSAEAHLLMGEINLRRGQLLAAGRAIEHAADLDPQTPGLDLARALLMARMGRPRLAAHHAVRAAHRFDHSPRAAFMLASFLLQAHRPGYAIRLATTLMERAPHDPTAIAASLRLRAQAQLMLNRPDQAVADLRQALRLLPCDAQALPLLARAYAQADRWTRARAILRRCRAAGLPRTQRRRLALRLGLDHLRRRLRR